MNECPAQSYFCFSGKVSIYSNLEANKDYNILKPFLLLYFPVLLPCPHLQPKLDLSKD